MARTTQRRRRRLRREVRVAITALLFGVPLVWALLCCWGPRADRGAETSLAAIPPVSVERSEPEDPPALSLDRPWATISLEPITPGAASEPLVPVVRPAGYLLPDEASEEPAHAGG